MTSIWESKLSDTRFSLLRTVGHALSFAAITALIDGRSERAAGTLISLVALTMNPFVSIRRNEHW